MDEHPEVLRQRGLDDAAEVEEMLAQRQRERAGGAVWTPPTLGPAEPVRRAVAPRQKPPPAPPAPDKITRVQHDGSGRITATESYTGAGAAAARSWDGFIRDLIDKKIMAFAESFGEGVGAELALIRKAERERADSAIAALTRRLEELERLADGRQSKEYRNAAD